MDLVSMLNDGQASIDLEQDAISTYRRLSSGSTNTATATAPASAQEDVDLDVKQRDRSSPSLKRKIDQVDEEEGGGPAGTPPQGGSKRSSVSTMMKEPARPGPGVVRNRAELGYTGKRPLDDLSGVVRTIVLHYLNMDPRTYGKLGLEIEAKLGTLAIRDSGMRFHQEYPIYSATVVNPQYTALRFTSNMTEDQHARFNRHLNEQVELRNPKHPNFDAGRPPMRYEHTKLTDSIYPSYRVDGIDMKPRVTINDKDGSVVETISKENIEHLHISCPNHVFDIRISINLEHTIQAPTSTAAPVHERQKDRVSYKLATHRIDLTKVGEAKKGGTYELEIELTDVENLKRQAELAADERPNSFDEILVGFIGTVMTLNKTANSFN